ncbi:acyltransferase [Enterobacter ludwigii]|uniref:acyltransferase family protein n=1 Tax=Enterobacter ludwigii TaxID=299767 RepID=UPI0011EFC799|nr:acyltransferase [Enterobacter ludwigii]KAA0520056.1 acyltransferase [Enterobacter ludwigii]
MDKIKSIHYLRGIAALIVVFFHFRGLLNGVYAQKDLGGILFGSGAFGVDLFFMISGFIISMSTQRMYSPVSFFIRRFFRIYPAFIFVFVVGMFTAYSNNPGSEIMKSLFFIHQDYSQPSPGFGYNMLGPAWTLTYEFYFYMLFMVAISISHKHRVALTSFMILTPIVLLQLYYNGGLSLSGLSAATPVITHGLYSTIRFISSPILVEFIIGMVLYEIYAVSKRLEIKYHESIFFVCIAIFLVFYFAQKNNEFGMHGFGIWALFLIIGCLSFDVSHAIKDNKALNFLGDISYSLYITHYLVMQLLNKYSPWFWVNTYGISKFILATTICICVAMLVYKFIELPFIRYGKSVDSIFRPQKAEKLQPHNGAELKN